MHQRFSDRVQIATREIRLGNNADAQRIKTRQECVTFRGVTLLPATFWRLLQAANANGNTDETALMLMENVVHAIIATPLATWHMLMADIFRCELELLASPLVTSFSYAAHYLSDTSPVGIQLLQLAATFDVQASTGAIIDKCGPH